MWPDGKLAESEPSRSDEEKLKTRMEAKEKMLQNMPGNKIPVQQFYLHRFSNNFFYTYSITPIHNITSHKVDLHSCIL